MFLGLRYYIIPTHQLDEQCKEIIKHEWELVNVKSFNKNTFRFA